jgi:outer membrane protein insertion porin family
LTASKRLVHTLQSKTLIVMLWACILAPGCIGQATPPAPQAPVAPPTGTVQTTVTPSERQQNPPTQSEPSVRDLIRPAGPLPAAGSFTQLQGARVSEVNFRGLHSPFAEAQIHDLILQKAGEPLDRNKIRESLRGLYATGRFANLEVRSTQKSDGSVSLTIQATENFFNGDVGVSGRPKHAPTDTQFINASKLNLGEAYSADKVRLGMSGMQRILQDYGFYRTQLSYEENPHSDTQQMDLVFHIRSGKPAKVGEVFVSGDPGYTADQIRKIGKLKKGKEVRNNFAPRSLELLRKKYGKQKRLEAQIALEQRKYDESRNALDYYFVINRGHIVEISTKGAKLSRRKLKKYVPIYEENAVDEDLLNEGRRNIRDYFQTLGYFDASVSVEQTIDGDRRKIVYTVEKGERHKLTDIVITGNHYFGVADLRERMSLQPASLLARNGRFSQSQLARDVEAIANLYRNNGFDRVKVTPQVQDDLNGEHGRMRASFAIEEGPQTLVHSLNIVGNVALISDQLTEDPQGGSRLEISPGQPYSEYKVATDRNAILNEYFNQGFANAELEPLATFYNNDPSQVDVTYKIVEGPRVFVDRVLVSGITFTQPHIVNREFNIRDGMSLSQDRMVDSQRRLYDLGIFNEVNMAVQNPEGSAEYKSLLYNIKEARRWTMNYGLGFEVGTGVDQGQGTGPQGSTGVSPNGQFDLTRENFRGRNQTIIVKTRYGRFVKRGLLSFDSPQFWDQPDWKLTLSLYYDNSRDVNTFASQRLEGSAQLEQTIGDPKLNTKMLYRFNYRRVKVDPTSFPAGFTPFLVQFYSTPVRVGMPALTFIRDRRDNAIDSHHGTYITADIGAATHYLASETDFGRVLATHSSYYELFKRRPQNKRYVLARSTRFGVQSPYHNSTVPLPEHFFAGGGNSLRGFAINQAGPRDPDTGGPLGGNAMFVNNVELRFPPMTLPFVADNLSFVAFHDMGNIFDTADNMWSHLFKWKQKDPINCSVASTLPCDFNYVTHSVGSGIRYRTPIGPIRVDVGYNLNPPVFPIKQGTNPHSETVRRFNFFFSIGQTF